MMSATTELKSKLARLYHGKVKLKERLKEKPKVKLERFSGFSTRGGSR
jgi:hypothetical protein